jgi:hypothetical protein
MQQKLKEKTQASRGPALCFEPELWQAANALRDSMDAARYKHIVLGLISLMYIPDAFEVHCAELETERVKAQALGPKPSMSAGRTTASDCQPRVGEGACKRMPTSPASASWRARTVREAAVSMTSAAGGCDPAGHRDAVQ